MFEGRVCLVFSSGFVVLGSRFSRWYIISLGVFVKCIFFIFRVRCFEKILGNYVIFLF